MKESYSLSWPHATLVRAVGDPVGHISGEWRPLSFGQHYFFRSTMKRFGDLHASPKPASPRHQQILRRNGTL